MGIIILIFELICTYYMVSYGMSRNRSTWKGIRWGAIFSLLMIILMWVVPYGLYPGLLWGAFCWADSRAGGN